MPSFPVPRRLLRCAGLAALLLLPATAPAVAVAAATGPPPDFRPFAPDSPFNLRLRDDAPLASRSAAWVASLQRSVAVDGTWINSSTCAVPVYWADADAPRVAVRLDSDYADGALQRAWSSVPMPPQAEPATCSDQHLAIYQRQSDGAIREWELWSATKGTDGWSAKWGGAISDVRADRGSASGLAWSDPSAPTAATRQGTWAWNVSASGIALTAGVITRQDLARGSIDHAVGLVVHDAARDARLWPAQRSDGTSADPDAIPEGAHLRLDPRLDLASIQMTPLVRMIAVAAQRYGIVVRDKSYANNAFLTEQVDAADDPVPALLGGQTPNAALRAFPWASLQVLDAPACTAWAPCEAPAVTRLAVDGTPRVGSALTLDTRNSTFGYPRTAVRWDLDGDGTPEVDGSTSPTVRWTPTRAGRQVVGVRTRLQDGTTSTGTATVDVAPASATTTTTTATTTAPVTRTTAPPSTTTTTAAVQAPPATSSVAGLLGLLGLGR